MESARIAISRAPTKSWRAILMLASSASAWEFRCVRSDAEFCASDSALIRSPCDPVAREREYSMPANVKRSIALDVSSMVRRV